MICQGAAAARPAIGAAPLRTRIDWFDPQPVGGLADQLFERRALQHAIDQLPPVVIGRRREIGGQRQIVGFETSFGADRSRRPFF